MSISPARKQELIKQYARGAKDTGSTEVQVVIFTERIINLTNHLKNNMLDVHSRRGLLLMVGKRKRLLKYLRKVSEERYNTLIKSLGLRQSSGLKK